MNFDIIIVLPLLAVIGFALLTLIILQRLSDINKSLDAIQSELSTLKNAAFKSVETDDKVAGETTTKVVETDANTPSAQSVSPVIAMEGKGNEPHEAVKTSTVEQRIEQPPTIAVAVKTTETKNQKPAEEKQTIANEEAATTQIKPSSIAITTSNKPQTDTIAVQTTTDKAALTTPIQPTHTTVQAPSSDESKVMTTNFERFIGENLFGKIGILVFILGIAYFVKYAIDQNWINEVTRTILGFGVGIAMLGVAQWIHKRYYTLSSLLAGGAFAVFYLTVSIAFHYYQLFTQTAAFVILCFTTIFMAAVSIRYNRLELAVTALIGGFIAPFIISSDTGNIIVLQAYLSILNLGMFVLALYKKWGLLPIVAFVFTYFILLQTVIERDLFPTPPHLFSILFGFAALFFFIFLIPVRLIMQSTYSGGIRKGLLSVITLNGFAYLLYGGYLIEEIAFGSKETGYLSFFIAIVYLVFYLFLRFRISGHDTLRNFMLALTIAFASIGVPLLFNSSAILITWSTESILLLWLFTKEKSVIYECTAAVLAALSFILCLTLGVFQDSDHGIFAFKMFLNSHFLSLFTFAVCSFLAAIIMQRNRRLFSKGRRLLRFTPCNVIAYAIGFLFVYIAFSDEFTANLNEFTANAASALTTTTMLLVGTLLLRRRFKVRKYKLAYVILLCAITFIYMLNIWSGDAFRLPSVLALQWISTLTVVILMAYVIQKMASLQWENHLTRSVFAALSTLVWLTGARLLLLTFYNPSFDAGFSLSLGLAAFILMVIGMRSKSKEVRMVSLAEFGIVLGKLILIDVWSMAALGKIVVFISLGLLLLMLSFLYQKLKDVLF